MKLRFLLYLIFFLPITTLYGQTTEVNILEFIKDVQLWKKQEHKMFLSWWIPEEYWEISLADNKQLPPGTLENIQTVMKDYVLICAADLTFSPLGSLYGAEESDLRASLTLYDDAGKPYRPLTEDEISTDARFLAGSLKPVFAQAIGEMGKSMYLFFFSVKDEKNNNLIAAAKKGSFKVVHSNNEFLWKLPLPTLMPPKHCPVDNEKMSGAWSFCPFHGNKLDQ